MRSGVIDFHLKPTHCMQYGRPEGANVDSTHLDNAESTGHAQIGKFLNKLLTLLLMAFKTDTLLISAARAR